MQKIQNWLYLYEKGCLKHRILALNITIMQTKTRSKPLLGLSALALLIGLSFASSSNVKSDLSHAVQTIQSVIFAPATTPNHSPIQLKGQGNKVHIKGKVLMTNDASNTLATSAENAQLYYGINNTLDAANSAMLYGKGNKIYGNYNSEIGWNNNHIGINNANSQSNLVIWGNQATINWNHSTIIGGTFNIIKGNKNLILFGKQKTINGDQNYAFGSYINNQNQSNNFIWGDNQERRSNQRIRPASSNTFIIRSANGLGVNTNTPQGQGVTVNGMVQLGNENVTCNAKTLGAMKFQEINKNGKTEGCFYTCEKHGNEIKWYAMAKQACGAKQNAPVQPPVQPNPDPEQKTCTISLQGPHINGTTIKIPHDGIAYNVDQYAISRWGALGQVQVELDSAWEKGQTTNRYTQYTNENRVLYFWPDFDQESTTQDPKIGLDIDSTWEGSYNLTIKNIVNGKELCKQKYTITKGVPHPTKYYRYLTAMPEFDRFYKEHDNTYAFWTEEKNSVPSFPTDADLWYEITPFQLLKNKLWKTWKEPEHGDSILSMYFEAPQYRNCWFKNYYIKWDLLPECPIQQTFNPSHIYGSCQKGQAPVKIPIKRYHLIKTPEGDWKTDKQSYRNWTIIFECKAPQM